MAGQDGQRHCATCGAPADVRSRFCVMCGAGLSVSGDSDDVRRHVVVLFADLAGFTSLSEGLDPEVLRSIMDRYFRLASRVIWGHGGTTEKFIGDAVMAVFGMPVVREDDALRAVRAAAQVITELDTLNVALTGEYGIELRVRIGVHSGPVSASYDTSGDLRVVGDVVNTASRLQSAASPGQVLVGEGVAQIVRPQVELEAVAPLTLKGKEAPVRAWRVVGILAAGDPVARRAPLIGRDVELMQLRGTYERTAARGRGAIATLLGPPGIGKSRLVEEFRTGLDGQSLTVLTGRAHSYGRGVTYQPVAELVVSAHDAWTAFEATAAVDADATRALSCLAGLSRRDATAGRGAEVEEIAWALRTFLAHAAKRCALVLLWEDLHWAEPTLLDVIEYLGSELADLPVMQLCIARPELLELRPDWSRGKVSALTLELMPLTGEETLRLVAELTRGGEVTAHDLDEVCERVTLACEGNPLFAELMLDTLASSTADTTANPVPHSVHAVLAARLDRLVADDRLVLEMAATVGREFAVADLELLLATDGRTGVDLVATMDRLRQSRLVAGSRLSSRHSFTQAFGRDTTYELTAKRDRLRWHVALAERAPTAGGHAGFDGSDELAYHLEAASMLARELHPAAEATGDITMRAAAALTDQATHAMDRKDLRAAAGLFERALLALPVDAPGRLLLALRLSDTWLGLGDQDRALAALDDQTPSGPAIVVQRELVHLRGGLRTADDLLDAEQRIEPMLDDDDDLGWCRFHQLRAHRHLMYERIGAAEVSLSAALARARSAGDRNEQDRVRRAAGELTVWGPTVVAQGLQRCAELTERFADSRVSLVTILAATGGLLGLDGQFDRARQALTTAARYAHELRMRSADIGLAHMCGLVESLAGDRGAAAAHFGRARAMLVEAGHAEGAALLAALAARELVAGGAPVPPFYAAMTDGEAAAITDPRTGALTGLLRMRAAAGTGDTDRTTALAEVAATTAARMDDPYFQGTVHHDIAIALALVGLTAEALAAVNAARRLFAAKGARAALEHADAFAAKLTGSR